MENASRAMIIVGGILIGMLIIGALAYMFTELGNYQSDQVDKLEVEQLAEFNEQFLTYDRDNVTIMELKSLYNKIESSNKRYDDPNFEVELIINQPNQDNFDELTFLTDVEGKSAMEILEKNLTIPTAVKETAQFNSISVKYRKNGIIETMTFEDVTQKR